MSPLIPRAPVGDGRALLRGVMAPMVTPMTSAGVPGAGATATLTGALARAGVRGLMLFGSNGEGPLLPTSALADFAADVADQWRRLANGGPVLVNVTAAGTAEALARAAAVAPAAADALVLSPPMYFHHRDDEIASHFAAFASVGVPVVAYNVPRYCCPMSAALVDELVAMPHVVGMKDSSGDLGLFEHIVAAARRRPSFGVSQGAETLLLAGLQLGADGIVPGTANLAPGLAVALDDAFHRGELVEAQRLQKLTDQLITLHQVRPGVPAVKAILDARGLCPPHVAAPFVECSAEERRDLLAAIASLEPHLIVP